MFKVIFLTRDWVFVHFEFFTICSDFWPNYFDLLVQIVKLFKGYYRILRIFFHSVSGRAVLTASSRALLARLLLHDAEHFFLAFRKFVYAFQYIICIFFIAKWGFFGDLLIFRWFFCLFRVKIVASAFNLAFNFIISTCITFNAFFLRVFPVWWTFFFRTFIFFWLFFLLITIATARTWAEFSYRSIRLRFVDTFWWFLFFCLIQSQGSTSV